MRRIAGYGVLGVVAAFAAAAVMPSASAAEAPAKRVAHFVPAKLKGAGDVGTQSASSGARSGDWNHDGFPDLLLRNNVGQLLVSLHSGTVNGTATYQPPVVINNGWENARWIGQADLNGDGNADVLALLPNGELRGYLHSGTFNGLNTLAPWTGPGPRPVLAYNIDIFDLLFTGDVTGDGKDDLMGRRAGTGRTFALLNSGQFADGVGFGPAQLMAEGPANDVEQNLADVTRDGVPDLLFVQPNGNLGVFSFTDGGSYDVSTGWQNRTALTLTDINKDGAPDLLGRSGPTGDLDVFTHRTTFDPNAPLNSYNVPVRVGLNYNTYSVIS